MNGAKLSDISSRTMLPSQVQFRVRLFAFNTVKTLVGRRCGGKCSRIKVAAKHLELLDHEDPADAFAITDDFMSAGRISGAQCVPIP